MGHGGNSLPPLVEYPWDKEISTTINNVEMLAYRWNYKYNLINVRSADDKVSWSLKHLKCYEFWLRAMNPRIWAAFIDLLINDFGYASVVGNYDSNSSEFCSTVL